MDERLMLMLVVAGTLVALFVLVLWVLLPFAVFGVKPMLRDLVRQQTITNEHLRALRGLPPEPPPPEVY